LIEQLVKTNNSIKQTTSQIQELSNFLAAEAGEQ
jgi:hypothetical protein